MYMRIMHRVLLLMQAAVLTYLFIYGPRGWHTIAQLQKNIDKAQQSVDEKKKLVTQLQEQESSWQHDSFNKEKVAREQLQMAKATDVVFYR